MTLIPMPFKSRKYASDITAVINPVVLPNTMSVPTHLVQRHLYFLRILSLASRILTVIASYSFAKLPLFDPSPKIVLHFCAGTLSTSLILRKKAMSTTMSGPSSPGLRLLCAYRV